MSLVCAVGVFGAQLGIALGFFLTPLLVHNHVDPKNIHQNLQVLLIGTAGISTFIAILIIGS
jgi:MFS transporter, FLVCR family, feline leukemia virus subgroup C receptor-related protein